MKKSARIPGIMMLIVAVSAAAALCQNGLEYKAKPGSLYEYEYTTETYTGMDRGSEIMEFTTTTQGNYSLEAEKQDTVLTYVMTIGKITAKSEGGRGGGSQDMSDYKGKRVRITLTPQGIEREPEAVDELPVVERGGRGGGSPRGGDRQREPRNPAARFRVSFFQLPDRPLKAGDKWTENYNGPSPANMGGRGMFGGGGGQDTGTKTYEVVGEGKKLGLNCLNLKVTYTFTRESYREFGENTISSEGEGETKWDIWFAPEEGVLVELNQDDFVETSTSMSGQRSGTSASVSENTRTIKLKKFKAGK